MLRLGSGLGVQLGLGLGLGPRPRLGVRLSQAAAGAGAGAAAGGRVDAGRGHARPQGGWGITRKYIFMVGGAGRRAKEAAPTAEEKVRRLRLLQGWQHLQNTLTHIYL